MQRSEVTRKMILRGAILNALYISQSAPMLISTLELSMLPENPQIGSELVPQLNWLRDMDYIRVVEPENPSVNPMRGALVRITALGQNVIEGNLRDTCVLLPGNAG